MDGAEFARQVAKAKKVSLNNLRKAFVDYWRKHSGDNKPSGLLSYDGNRFDQQGYELVAEQMLRWCDDGGIRLQASFGCATRLG